MSPGKKTQAGFSLVEMLVVLAIIALVTAAVALNTGRSAPSLASEADRLLVKVAAARDLALARNRAVRIELAAEGYVTLIRNRTGWAPAEEAAGAVVWESGTGLVAQSEDLPLAIQFDSIGSVEPTMLVLEREGRRETIVLDASGNVRRERGGGG